MNNQEINTDLSSLQTKQENTSSKFDSQSFLKMSLDGEKKFKELLFKKVYGKLPLIIICVVSFTVRFVAASETQGYIHPDEVFQSIEMVHYWIYGKYGEGQTIPWEFNERYAYGGARSWFFVLILVGIYKFVMIFGVTDPLHLILSVRIFLSLTSMISVIVTYLFAKRALNKRVGLIAAFLVGTWWFFPFWASRTMTDSLSCDLLLLGLYLFYTAQKDFSEKLSKKYLTRATFAGVCIGLAFMIRFPSALMGFPIVIWGIVYSIFYFQKADKILANKDRIDSNDEKVPENEVMKVMKNEPVGQDFLNLTSTNPPLAFFYLLLPTIFFCFGAFLMVIYQGLLDLFTWGSFLQSPINFFMYNIVEGYSAHHGTAPWYHYFVGFYTDFALYFLPLILLLIGLGIWISKKSQLLFVGLLISIPILWIIIFSSIAHKEFRFLMVTLPLLFILVAKGIDELGKLIKEVSGKEVLQELSIYFILALFASGSLLIATTEKKVHWKVNSGICHAMYWVGQQEDVETVIVLESVWYTGGYAYLNKNVSCRFVHIYSNIPSNTFNSSYNRYLYQQPGTYVIVRSNEWFVVWPVLEEFNMTFRAKTFGYPTCFIYQSSTNSIKDYQANGFLRNISFEGSEREPINQGYFGDWQQKLMSVPLHHEQRRFSKASVAIGQYASSTHFYLHEH
jgi:hypothetical protein